MKRKFRFIFIMVMAVAFTMTTDAKNVYFATHRFIRNEYGEHLPKKESEAYCPTRIEIDINTKTLLIKTKNHGTANYIFSEYIIKEKGMFFYDANDVMIGCMLFLDNDLNKFAVLAINKKNDNVIMYVNSDNMINYY